MTPEAVRDAIEQVHTTRDYSGRAMYGKACVGIVINDPIDAILDIVEEFARSGSAEQIPDLCYELRNHRVDSMGRDQQILYWPNLPWEEKEDDD